ncbi:DUF3105 domain-containing protein [Halorarum halobium]|uniref:DUF3105 domain-containing protein n=1 Tax=Halorarum halobium TaxID=3075121 RepID=UPI0028A928BB|nr:DUF3105 domain-containing protein [Halobaculum sp. XH14]
MADRSDSGRRPHAGDAAAPGSRPSTRRPSTRRAVLGVVAGATILPLSGCLGLGGGGGIEAESLPEGGDDEVISNVETFPSEGVDHVRTGTEIEYDTRPPTSGPHYNGTLSAGFYEDTQPLGNVVHTLEHGAVVVYYGPDALTDESRNSLQAWANNHTSTWQSFVAVPYYYDDPETGFTLTAWRHMLGMDEYDAETVRAFCAEYLGRGPENPVR